MHYISTYGLLIIGLLAMSCSSKTAPNIDSSPDFDYVSIVEKSDSFMLANPHTISEYPAIRSKGGSNDYYSEGPYWRENPDDPDGPHIRKDGQRNPNMFTAHRSALKDFEDQIVNLTAAYLITEDKKYSEKAKAHLLAWFVTEDSKMNPHLLYAQAIKGIVDGRGIGIIDAVGLINVVNAIQLLHHNNQISPQDYVDIQKWFDAFTSWLTTSNHGNEEANNGNNHSTWWGAQVASYSSLTGNQVHRAIAEAKFQEQLDHQMDEDGSFPHELSRTKPWHYMNYTTRAWVNYALLLSVDGKDYWHLQGKNGSIDQAMVFNYKFMNDPSKWPYDSNLEKELTVNAEDHFYLSATPLNEPKYKALWKKSAQKKGIQDGRLLLFAKLYNL